MFSVGRVFFEKGSAVDCNSTQTTALGGQFEAQNGVQVALGGQFEGPSGLQVALGGQFEAQNGVQVALGGQFEEQNGVQVALGGQLGGPSGAQREPKLRKKSFHPRPPVGADCTREVLIPVIDNISDIMYFMY